MESVKAKRLAEYQERKRKGLVKSRAQRLYERRRRILGEPDYSDVPF
jgi:hypothetical protein